MEKWRREQDSAEALRLPHPAASSGPSVALVCRRAWNPTAQRFETGGCQDALLTPVVHGEKGRVREIYIAKGVSKARQSNATSRSLNATCGRASGFQHSQLGTAVFQVFGFRAYSGSGRWRGLGLKVPTGIY